jgi:hypothetical protein
VNAENINPISSKAYVEEIKGVVTQFRLVRFSLETLSTRKLEEFVQRTFVLEKEAIEKRHHTQASVLRLWGKDNETLIKLMEEHRDRQIRGIRKKIKGQQQVLPEFSEDRLNQSELLLLVAYFEVFLKKAYNALLKAAPEIGFKNSQKKVELREVVSPHFFRGEREKAVKNFDKDRIRGKIETLAEFQIKVATEAQIKALETVMKIRNQISHEILAEPAANLDVIKEQPLATTPILEEARTLFSEIPQLLCREGKKLFPKVFA